MEKKVIDTNQLNKALAKFGSLEKANAQLEKEKKALDKRNAQLKQENQDLASARDNLTYQVDDINNKKEFYKKQAQSLYDDLQKYNYQYELFCGFLAMVAGSPSVTDSAENIIAIFQVLKEHGWCVSKNAGELRTLFVHIVMGDSLKCFRCNSCGARFMVNKTPHYKIPGNYYCPSCFSTSVTADDTFLKALLTKEQVENVIYTEQVVQENQILQPFRAFFSLPCEICHDPVTEWDDYNVKIAIDGMGIGHTDCWNTEVGRSRQFLKTIEILRKAMKGGMDSATYR